MKRETRYGYVCGAHEVSSPKPLTKCPGFIQGAPCSHPLKQVAGPKK
jgi:hypothetical protein